MTDEKQALPPEGVYSIELDDYLALPYFSNSDLRLVRRSPAHYYAKRVDPSRKPEVTTPAQLAGKILHTAILEPEKFDEQFVVVPPDAPKRPSVSQRKAKRPSKATTEAIQWWDEWEADNGDKQIIEAEQSVEYRQIAKTIREHPEMTGFMAHGKAELTFIGKDPTTDLMCKCRPDWIGKVGDDVFVIDLKSTEDARLPAFERSAYNYGYFTQAAFYLDVIEWAYNVRPTVFIFAAFEKKPPYAMKLYEATDEALVRATKEYEQSLLVARGCVEDNDWPAYPTDIETLSYPAWAKE